MSTQTLSVQMSTQQANPFYGLRNCLNLFQSAGKGNVTDNLLHNCWTELRTKEDREMFFSLLFSIGDITARQHNIFKGNKVDSGGNAQREAFIFIYNWLKDNHFDQWKAFLHAGLFNQYVSYDLLFMNRVKTKIVKKKIIATPYLSFVPGTAPFNELALYVANKIDQKTNPYDCYFIAKFLTRPRTSKRKGHKMMLPETLRAMRAKEAFLKKVSELCGFEVIQKPTHKEFPGYINWRKEYIGDLESVMFSSKKILDFDEQQFLNWLDKLPSSARFRVRCRLLDKNNKPKEPAKWNKLPEWFLKWEEYKNNKQTEQRVLEEKVRQGVATEKDTKKLETVKKQAKVNAGAVNFQELFASIIKGNIDKVMVQPFLDKINLPYNTLVFMDDSGSMQSTGTNGITAFDMACFIATICLMKNPDDSGRSLLGMFSSKTRLFNMMTSKSELVNKLVKSKSKSIREDLINPNLHFLDNLQRMRQFVHSQAQPKMTLINTISTYIEDIVLNNPDVKEQLQSFPVWTFISDGNFNSLYTPEASLSSLLRSLEDILGFKPYIIIIDVANTSSAVIDRFSGIENVMYIPPNPAQIEQFLMNYKDFKVYDIYTPLESIYNSNRYSPIRERVL